MGRSPQALAYHGHRIRERGLDFPIPYRLPDWPRVLVRHLARPEGHGPPARSLRDATGGHTTPRSGGGPPSGPYTARLEVRTPRGGRAPGPSAWAAPACPSETTQPWPRRRAPPAPVRHTSPAPSPSPTTWPGWPRLGPAWASAGL